MSVNKKTALCVAIAAIISGCGGKSSETTVISQNNELPESVKVTGTVMKGLVNGAEISACVVSNKQITNSCFTSPIATDGTYSLLLPKNLMHFQLVPSSNSTMLDEALGKPINIPLDFKLRAGIDLSNNANLAQTVNITPLSDMAVQTVFTQGGMTTDSITKANQGVSVLYGFNNLTTKPINSNSSNILNATDEEKHLSLTLATISQMAKDKDSGCDIGTDGQRVNCVVNNFSNSLALDLVNGVIKYSDSGRKIQAIAEGKWSKVLGNPTVNFSDLTVSRNPFSTQLASTANNFLPYNFVLFSQSLGKKIVDDGYAENIIISFVKRSGETLSKPFTQLDDRLNKASASFSAALNKMIDSGFKDGWLDFANSILIDHILNGAFGTTIDSVNVVNPAEYLKNWFVSVGEGTCETEKKKGKATSEDCKTLVEGMQFVANVTTLVNDLKKSLQERPEQAQQIYERFKFSMAAENKRWIYMKVYNANSVNKTMRFLYDYVYDAKDLSNGLKDVLDDGFKLAMGDDAKDVIRSASSALVFSDDFNDAVDDLTKWEFSGAWNTKPKGSASNLVTTTSHTEKEGYLELRMDVTDVGSAIRSAKFTPQNHIKVEFKHFMHQGPANYYFPYLSLVGKDDKSGVNVTWRKSAYGPDNWCAAYNQPELSSYESSIKSYCMQKGSNMLSSDYYEKWITTVMEYSAITGEVTVDFDGDGVVELSGTVDASIRNPIERVVTGTFGWWTGHSHKIDYIKVTSLP